MASGLILDYLGSGAIADRPATPDLYAGSLGLWFATDTEVLSLWDGSTWTDVSGSAVNSVNGLTGTVVLALDDIDDVDAAAPSDGDVLTWVAANSAWEPAAGGGGGGADRSTVTAVSSSSGVVTLNYALGDYFTLTLTENVTSWVISNPPGSGKGFTLMVQITQDSTPRTVAKPGTTAGGAALDVSTGSGDVDVLAISSFDNGTTLRSSIGKDFS